MTPHILLQGNSLCKPESSVLWINYISIIFYQSMKTSRIIENSWDPYLFYLWGRIEEFQILEKEQTLIFPMLNKKLGSSWKNIFLWEISLCLSKSYLTIYRNQSQKLPVPKMPFMCDTHCLKLPKWGGYQQATVEAKNEAFSEIIHSSSLSTFRFMKFCPEWEKFFFEQFPEVTIAAHLHDTTQKHRAKQQYSELASSQGCCVCRGQDAQQPWKLPSVTVEQPSPASDTSPC